MSRRSLVPFVVSALLATSCSSLEVAAATVNGEKITEGEVESELETLRADPIFGEALRHDPDTRGQRRREILRELIYQTVATQQARRLHVLVTRAQEERLIGQAARSRGMSVAKFLDSERLSSSQAHRIAERAVRRFALQDKVVRDVVIPDDEVRSVYEGQKERFAEVHLERITVRDAQTARLAITDVGSGKTFEEVARARSTDPLRDRGGDMGYVQLTSLDTQVQGAVDRAVQGGLTDPIQSEGGFVIYRVVDRRTKSFDEVEKDIRNSLRQNQRDSFYEGWLAERVRDAKIVVNPKYGRFDKRQGQPTVVPSSRKLAP